MSLKCVASDSTKTEELQLPPQLSMSVLPPPLLWNVPPAVTPTSLQEAPLSPALSRGHKSSSLPPVSPHYAMKVPDLPRASVVKEEFVKEEEQWATPDLISELDQFEFLEPIRPDLCVDELPQEVERELEAQKRKRRIKSVKIDPSLPKAKRQKLDRMRRNRESAQKSREKKARHRAMLNEQVRLLETKNAQLKKAISLLTDQATEAQTLRCSNDQLLKELQAAQEEHNRLQSLHQSPPGHGRTINIMNHLAPSAAAPALQNGVPKAEPKPAPAATPFPVIAGSLQPPTMGSVASSHPWPRSMEAFNSAFNRISAASRVLAASPTAKIPFFNDLLENQQRLMPNIPGAFGLALPPLAPSFPQPGLASPRIPLPTIEMN